jgi:hypothetical protein
MTAKKGEEIPIERIDLGIYGPEPISMRVKKVGRRLAHR